MVCVHKRFMAVNFASEWIKTYIEKIRKRKSSHIGTGFLKDVESCMEKMEVLQNKILVHVFMRISTSDLKGGKDGKKVFLEWSKVFLAIIYRLLASQWFFKKWETPNEHHQNLYSDTYTRMPQLATEQIIGKIGRVVHYWLWTKYRMEETGQKSSLCWFI